MTHYLAIMEVSQKQAYIFSSNKLRNNIDCSEDIVRVTSDAFFRETTGDPGIYSSDRNLVYSGGGHTVLEFDDKDQATGFVKTVTFEIKKEYPDLEIFVSTLEFDPENAPEGGYGSVIKELRASLERKKAKRLSSFHQGSFGIEQIDSNTLRPESVDLKRSQDYSGLVRTLFPEGIRVPYSFEDIGVSRDSSSFIAVVHIDGNAMGKRIEKLYSDNQFAAWEDYKRLIREFSASIDRDFKAAFREMTDTVRENINDGYLSELSLKDSILPLRNLITAGDDICFVSEGRIGLECAVSFIQALCSRKNEIDHQSYAACAGIAIVHKNYPFFKAYELAEALCSSAKRYGVGLEPDGTVSLIDWHISYGELEDKLEDIRDGYYDASGKLITNRPYIINGPQDVLAAHPARLYDSFKKNMLSIQNKTVSAARGKLKEIRPVILRGEDAVEKYLQSELIDIFSSEEKEMLFDTIDRYFCGNE